MLDLPTRRRRPSLGPEAEPENRGCLGLTLAERDRLCALPERQAAELGQLLEAFHDGREVIPRERAGLRSEGAVSVGEEELGLRDAAGEQQQLARRRVAGRVLRSESEIANW